MSCDSVLPANTAKGRGNVENLILYQKFADFVMWYEPIVERFPACQKPALCATTKNTCYRIMRMIIMTNKRRDKRSGLYEIDCELEVLRFYVRHAYKRRYLSKGSYETAVIKLGEVGKILGGLLKSENK